MDEWTKATIKDIADKARKKVKGGFLFGYPINMNDPDMLVAAIYLMATREEQRKGNEELDHILNLFMGK